LETLKYSNDKFNIDKEGLKIKVCLDDKLETIFTQISSIYNIPKEALSIIEVSENQKNKLLQFKRAIAIDSKVTTP